MTLNSIVANFQTFKLVDLLDILIIAFLIYQLLGFVNRTRAGQLFKGALLVMAVYLVAETLNMRTVTWLLSCICAGIERMETETGQIYWNGELKRCLSHLEGVDERYRESDQRQLAELNTRNK